jgi:hypothetical protein
MFLRMSWARVLNLTYFYEFLPQTDHPQVDLSPSGLLLMRKNPLGIMLVMSRVLGFDIRQYKPKPPLRSRPRLNKK